MEERRSSEGRRNGDTSLEVVVERVKNLDQTVERRFSDLENEMRTIRRGLYGLALSIAGSAITFALVTK